MRSEFQFIQHFKDKFSLEHLGDDCAILPLNNACDLLITADLLVEDVDFKLRWADAFSIGHKALAVSLSDIAAMGGSPKWSLISIGVPNNLWNGNFLDDLYDGWHCLSSEFGVELVGGDTSRSPDRLVVDSVVLGEVPRGMALRRTGAKPGDSIFVSGTLGGAAAGLQIVESNNRQDVVEQNENLFTERLLRPIPRIRLAEHLNRQGSVTSMIDISDGLSSDLNHLCESSGVGALIEFDKLPAEKGLENVFVSENDLRSAVLNGGEDFELLFTSQEDSLASIPDIPITKIGTITSESQVMEIRRDGKLERLLPAGFVHF